MDKKDPKLISIGIVFVAIVIGIFAVLVSANKEEAANENDADNRIEEEDNIEIEEETEEDIEKQEEVVEPIVEEVQVPSYSVIKEANVRYDDAVSYYILIDPVDLNNDNFKEQIKLIIDVMVEKKGKKISLEIYDDAQTLELSYDANVNLSMEVDFNIVNQMEERHLVAAFSGKLDTGMYGNDLYFFPAAFRDHPEVGQYVDITEYNPTSTK